MAHQSQELKFEINNPQRLYPSNEISFGVVWERSELAIDVSDARTRSVHHHSAALPNLFRNNKVNIKLPVYSLTFSNACIQSTV